MTSIHPKVLAFMDAQEISLDDFYVDPVVEKHAQHDQKSHGNWANGGGQSSLFDTGEVPLSTEAERTLHAEEKAREFSALALKGVRVDSLGMYVYDEDTLDQMYRALKQSRAAWQETSAVLDGASAQFNWYVYNERAMNHAVKVTKALHGLDPQALNDNLGLLLEQGHGADLVRAIQGIADDYEGEFTYWNPGHGSEDPNNGGGGIGGSTFATSPEPTGYIKFYGEVLTAEIQRVMAGAAPAGGPFGATKAPHELGLPGGNLMETLSGEGSVFQEYSDATGTGHFRRAMKSSVVDRLTDRVKAMDGNGITDPQRIQDFTDELVHGWAKSSASYGSAAVQEWAAEFHDNQEAWDSFASRQGHETARKKWQGSMSLPPDSKFVDNFGKAVYAETQALLAATGQDDVQLFRGTNYGTLAQVSKSLPASIRWDFLRQAQGDGSRPSLAHATAEGPVRGEDLSRQPISSWATDRTTADNFARGNETGVTQEALVPRGQIFSTAMTGPGAWHENEVIAFDAPGETWVVADMPLSLLSHRPKDAGPITINPTAAASLMGRDMPIDGDGDGWVNDDSGNPVFVGVSKDAPVLDWDKMLNWLPPEELPGWNVIEKFNPYHDALGRFTSAGNAVTIGAMPSSMKGSPGHLVALTRVDGGLTFNPKRKNFARKGFALAVTDKAEEKYPIEPTDGEDWVEEGVDIVKRYMKRHADLLAQPNAHLGTWVDGGTVYLDVSVVVQSADEAAKISASTNQIAFFDLGTFTEWRQNGDEYEPVSKSSSPVVYTRATDLKTDADIRALVEFLLSQSISKHADHDQKTHGNWARGGEFRDAHGMPTVEFDSVARYQSRDGVEFELDAGRWTVQDGDPGTLQLMKDEYINDWVHTALGEDPPDVRSAYTVERLERLSEQYLRYDDRHNKLKQQVQAADELLGRASLNDQGGVDALNSEYVLASIERTLNIAERQAFGDMGPGAKEHQLNMMARRYTKSIEGGTLSMRITEDALESVVFGGLGPDGEFLNQHTSGSSNGWFGPDRRVNVEMSQGVPLLVDAGDRPKYGYIEGTNWPARVEQYGDVTVRFKDDIADRTTVSFGDSLNSDLDAVRLSDLRAGSATPERVVSSASDHTYRKMWTDDSRYWTGVREGGSSIHYVEAQYHGRLSLSDVREVSVDIDYRPYDPEQFNYVVQELASQGVPTTVDVHTPSGKASKVVTGIDADNDGWIFEGTDQERRG